MFQDALVAVASLIIIRCWACSWVRKTNLSGGSKICRGAAGAGVWQGGASTAAHWGGRGSTSRGFWDARGLTQDAMPLETSPSRAPTEEELVQELNLESDRSREEEKNREL